MTRHGHRKRLRATALIAMLLASSRALSAHEFWIEPESYEVGAGEQIVASLRVGSDLKGAEFPYLSDRFISFQVNVGETAEKIVGAEGDYPAIRHTSLQDGLHVITYYSTADRLTYDDPQTFVEYVEYEGLEWALARHKQRGLPEKGFTEKYTRCAKVLLQVGVADEADQDVIVGMPLELVALQNPYEPGQASLEVQLLWRGEPLGDIQIALFRKGEGEGDEVIRQTTRTDKDGKARLDIAEAGDYLLNAVQITEVDDGAGVVWESHWASMTFRIAQAH